jgi:RIO kinase 1
MEDFDKFNKFQKRLQEFKVYKNVFDSSTINAIWRLITQGRLEGLESPIKIGKESNVFSAKTKQNERIAVKIYRINSAEFNRMYSYIITDKRFRIMKNQRQVILTWAKREFVNLERAWRSGVSVPKPIAILSNVLLMEFIGEYEEPVSAPKLKDYSGDFKKLFSKLLESMKKLHQVAKLAHGDLSEYNILVINEKPVIIDLSHALPLNCQGSDELLVRDVKNVCNFFNRKGLKLNPEDILSKIKGK